MAKQKKSLNFKNAVIDTEDMTISEYNKDGDMITQFDLVGEVLALVNGRDGITLTISYDEDM
jgi:hypothetical protein